MTISITHDPTFLGRVTAVSGASVTVRLAESLASGLALIGGQTYRVGQVGSFVRIPQGYQDLYGIVSEVGANAAPGDSEEEVDDARWMRVELVGETIGGQFERGLSQHPNINDTVHIVTDADLHRVYGGEGDDQIAIGTLSSTENVTVRLSLDYLLTRHSAILGSTGAGKSTTVANLLRSILAPADRGHELPGARILLLDIHAEYSAALGDLAKVFSATPQPGQHNLYVPFWALDASELIEFLVGPLSEGQNVALTDKIQELKETSISLAPLPGIEPNSLTVDSPVPFSLKRLWYELIDFETMTLGGPLRDVPQLEQHGDENRLTPPKYAPYAMGSAGPFANPQARGIRRQLNFLRSRLLDRRYDFILHPGAWEPDHDGRVTNDLDQLLQDWLGERLTILDLSSVPSSVLTRLVGSILRIIFEALYWSRDKTEGGVLRPLLIVMEEAHRYLAEGEESAASTVVKRIAKEGRKYGIGGMIVSQRPSEVDETILSQCGTIIAMRLTNPSDRMRVRSTLPDNLAGLMDLLPVLRTGETIVTGEAARLPVRCRVTAPIEKHQPRSADPKVSESWAVKRTAEDYQRVVVSWRAQRTTAVVKPVKISRKPVPEEEA